MATQKTSALQQALQWIESGFGLLTPQKKQQTQQPVDKKQLALETLIKNTMAQTAYTPQAQAFINNQIPIDYYNSPTNYSPVNPAVPANAAAVTMGGPHPRIVIRDNVLNNKDGNAVEILRHEINHALDSNVNGMPNTSYLPTGANSANSRGIRPQYSQKASGYANNYLNSFLNLYGTQGQPAAPQTQDVESFAHLGEVGQRILLDKSKIGNYYNNIFTPVSKKINYSPVFKAQPYEE